MDLTPLEADLAGDLAQADHQLFEVFQFVRLHHGRDPATVRAVGRALLASWIARGWLTVPPDAPPGRAANAVADITEVVDAIDRAETLDAAFPGAGTWLRLTPQAAADVQWLAPAT